MRGILLFAFNGGFDYINLAVICAKRIKTYMNLPITLVTDNKNYLLENYSDSVYLFDKIIESLDDSTQLKRFYNGSKEPETFVWKNFNRTLSYDLSPYDHTLVMDIDYIVSSNFLEKCFDIDADFLLFKDFHDLAPWRNNYEFQYVSNFSIPFYWATVFFFKKTNKNKIFFELLKYIQSNWDYYRLLYQINQPTYRNDYAFSIALHIFSGYYFDQHEKVIPGKIYFVQDKDLLLKANNDSLLFLVQKENSSTNHMPVMVNNLDIHIMNKFSILENLQ